MRAPVHAVNQEVALEVEGLRAGYGGRLVLDQINFRVFPGEIRVILGKSGCGKSTLLNHILGLERAMAGNVIFWGERVSLRTGYLPDSVRKRCGVLFQNGALLSSLSVASNVALPLRVHRPDYPDVVVSEIVAQKLASVGLLHAWHRLPGELSGGMRKRAALARALALDPDILFCDEPSAGLDPVTARGLDDLLLSLRAQFGMAVVVVTHDLDSVRLIADRILFLSEGRILFDGDLAQALECEIREIRAFFAGKEHFKREMTHGDHQS